MTVEESGKWKMGRKRFVSNIFAKMKNEKKACITYAIYLCTLKQREKNRKVRKQSGKKQFEKE